MNKYIISLTILLTGCSAWVSKSELEKATELCKNNNSVAFIKAEWGVRTQVICGNGAHFILE